MTTIGERGAHRLNWNTQTDQYTQHMTLEQATDLLHQDPACQEWPKEHVANFVAWLAEAQPPWQGASNER